MPTAPATTSNLRGIFFMLLAGLSFVGNDSLIKLTLSELPPMQVLMLRGLFGCLWSLPVLLFFGFGKDISKAFRPWIVLRSLMELLAIMAFIRALAHMPIGDVTAIYQISPLLVTGGAALLWREKIRPPQYALIAVALVGALLVAQPGSATSTIYAVFPFLTAVGAAARDLTSRRVTVDVPGLVVGFSTIVIVLAAATVLHVTTETWVQPSTNSISALAAAGFFLLLGQTFIFLAYRSSAAGAVAPFGYMFTFWAVLSGFFFFSEVPNTLSLAGMALIVSSGIAAIIYEQRRARPVAIAAAH